MNPGMLQTSLVQQMMAGNSAWWSPNGVRPPLPPPPHSPAAPLQLPSSQASAASSSSSSSPASSSSSVIIHHPYPPPSSLVMSSSWNEGQDFPDSWSQLLLYGLVGDEKGYFGGIPVKKMENWDDQMLMIPDSSTQTMAEVKKEHLDQSYVYSLHHHQRNNGEDLQATRPTWPQINHPVSSPPSSCITNYSSGILDFSNSRPEKQHHTSDRSPECNSSATGSAPKKARIQTTSPGQTQFKVRKEKLGDRIAALHQLVSPFGKTDTASVLLEAIGYIRFLQSQIECLSSPYMGSASACLAEPVQCERGGCIFPEDPGQLLNESCLKRRAAADQVRDEQKKDLRSRGLCLVPVSCILPVGSENGADFWAPAIGGGGFR
ncbi:Transcription factor [Nymphaea thermarum]|nr:Transcription factor [Nymphaea thermarum]